MTDLVKRLLQIGDRISTPCPDGIKGCLVYHFRIETDPTCKEAADRLEALEAENERLREALGLADAALRGANMNMNVVERKLRAALEARHD